MEGQYRLAGMVVFIELGYRSLVEGQYRLGGMVVFIELGLQVPCGGTI